MRTSITVSRSSLFLLCTCVVFSSPISAEGQECFEWILRGTGGPSRRDMHAMAFDSAREVTVLFGGFNYSDETWEWDGSTWTLRATGAPSGRERHAMAYDAGRGVTVLFGGACGNCDDTQLRKDTWEWDGVAWTLRATEGPAARAGHRMAYDAARKVTVLFAGFYLSGGLFKQYGDTWEWDGIRWTLRATQGPAPRYFHGMAYDAARRVTVLFGGVHGIYYHLGDTWEWNGSTWIQRFPAKSPSKRAKHTAVFDPTRATTVVFGGEDYEPGGWTLFDETWEWDGGTWRLRVAPGPSARIEHAMAFDTHREVGVLFGGSPGEAETWECRIVTETHPGRMSHRQLKVGWRLGDSYVSQPSFAEQSSRFPTGRRGTLPASTTAGIP